MMRLAQAGCMTTSSDVPRSQTEIGTKYVAANSLIYLIWPRSVWAPSNPPPLFEHQDRAENSVALESVGSGHAQELLHIP